MGSAKWTSDELLILKSHYSEHGPDWVGWEMLLPARTQLAIQSQAKRIGITDTKPVVKKKRKRKRRSPPKASVDPYAKTVMKMLKDGMTTSEVDAHMKWKPGKAKLILTDYWNSKDNAR